MHQRETERFILHKYNWQWTLTIKILIGNNYITFWDGNELHCWLQNLIIYSNTLNWKIVCLTKKKIYIICLPQKKTSLALFSFWLSSWKRLIQWLQSNSQFIFTLLYLYFILKYEAQYNSCVLVHMRPWECQLPSVLVCPCMPLAKWCCWFSFANNTSPQHSASVFKAASTRHLQF